MKIRRMFSTILLGAAACAALGTAGCSDEATPAPTTQPPDTTVTTELQLRNDMRKLWTDHVTWTRVFLIDAIAGLPDTPEATDRLLRNQDDLGNAIKPFYGDAAGKQLTALLREHILGAAAVLEAAKAGDKAAFDKANADWYANGYEIAHFLAVANPKLPEDALKAMMDKHLDQTLVEASARLEGNWQADVEAYDAIVEHILMMADALSAGIAAQFPEKIGDDPISDKNADLHRAMRALWEDHVTWTRVFLIDAIAGLPDTDAATARLLQNQVDIGNAVKPFYGAAAGDQLAQLLHDHITIAAEVVVAAKSAQKTALVDAKLRWYGNADAIAEFLAKANPNWSVDDLKMAMKMHLDQTLAEATARLTGDWKADVKDYDIVVDHILGMADFLSDGIAKQFPDKVGE